ncbi:hypothetical protein MKW92_033033 [Papaver armeniacum]|nr:hypothetical protein MKW92_033033 [Papaver armeniacum]
MEQVEAQISRPVFMQRHHPVQAACFNQEPPPMSRKRELSLNTSNWPQQHLPQFQQQQYGLPNSEKNWNCNVWMWDSVKFVAKPLEADVTRNRSSATVGAAAVTNQRRKGEENSKSSMNQDDRENLALNLGGSLYSVDEHVSRPSKRIRSGSPGGVNGSASYPMCQVDDCRGNLSQAKDYHRRHKVCEIHSKTTKALVGKQMQRFCQQCSRFHPLLDFDDGKRSCRRRLAGHNRRRRKTQQEDVSSRLLVPGKLENNGSGNSEIVNIIQALAHLQGTSTDRNANISSIPDRDWLIRILNKMNSLPVAANNAARLALHGGFDLNVSQEVSTESSNKVNENFSASSTMDLLAIFSAALKECSPEVLAVLSQTSSHNDDDKLSYHKNSSPVSTLAGGDGSATFQSRLDPSSCQVQECRPGFPLQLFGSSSDSDSPPNMGSPWKYYSSDSSNPMEEKSPAFSSPGTTLLFPLRTPSSEIMKHESISITGENNVEDTPPGGSTLLELFKHDSGRVGNSSVRSPSGQPGYTSQSGSDQSPTSSSDSHDRTGRIIFKLFDKDPSNLPGNLRAEIINWLSHSPSDIESYIRPGCVILSIYTVAPSRTWEQFQQDFLQRVKLLVNEQNSDFWRNGRFLIHTGRQLASHKDGNFRLCKAWRTQNSPELMFVSPLAVVGGQQTTLLLRGRNLRVPGTKIHCAYMGGYTSKEVTGSAGTIYDRTSAESFNFSSEIPNVLGRCFIEVENGFKGNSFPLIIADSSICQELRLLEPELEIHARVSDGTVEQQNLDSERLRSREDIFHFLHELGWLFQRKNIPSSFDGLDFSHGRFKFLFIFSIERDWCALVKRLLDILVERNMKEGALSRESLENLSEIHLLHRAVKRKCRSMVDLLIKYSLTSTTGAPETYLFSPSQMGPGGLTPLHLAACLHDSKEMVDILTEDPQKVGIDCWYSLYDANGQSPYDYASMRNNHYYNRMVDRKVAVRKQGQVSIDIEDNEISSSHQQQQQQPQPQLQLVQGRRRPCSRCAVVPPTRRFMRMPGTQGLLHVPYVHSMLAIAAMCVCVCLLMRGSPQIGDIPPFMWAHLGSGIM